MPGLTDDQITAARSVDLLSYLQSCEPGSIKKCGPGEYCLLEHDSLKISNGKWCWHSRGFGGVTALDFLIKVRGMGFVAAVETLIGGQAAPSWERPPPTPEKPKKLFALPLPNRNSHRAAAYLMGRGVGHEVINHCLRAGTLYEDTRHNCVFVGMDAEGSARFACVRSTTGDYKKDIPGSDKRHSFAIPGGNSPALYVFEAPIDLLSFVTLRPEDMGDAHYLSLGGVSPLALEQYLADHPGITSVTLCLDADPPGRIAAGKLRATLEERGCAVSDTLPPSGKDWNQHLQSVIAPDKTALPSRPREAAISI
jgi:hypothetical protein